MTNSLIPTKYKNEFKAAVILEKFSIVGANSTIMPGVIVAEGCSVGAMSLILKSTISWGVYMGIPAKRVRERSKEMLKLTKEFLCESNK